MFRTDGFLTLHELEDRLPMRLKTSELKEVAEMHWFEGTSLVDLMENQLFWAAIDHLHFCSPQGQVVRWLSEDIFTKVAWDDFDDGKVLSDLIRNEFALTKPYVDADFGIEVHGSGIRDEQPWPTLPLFFLRRSYTVSLDGFRLLRDRVLGHLSHEERVRATGLGFEHETLWKVVEQFEGWSICVPEEDFPEKPQLPSDPTEGARSEAQVARNIVSAWKAGEIRNKTDARDRFGVGITKRGFNRAWDRAAEILPEIRRPGRKSQNT